MKSKIVSFLLSATPIVLSIILFHMSVSMGSEGHSEKVASVECSQR